MISPTVLIGPAGIPTSDIFVMVSTRVIFDTA